MKKHYIFKFFLLMIPLSAFILMSSSGGRTDARTGSPGDGASCASCHSGGNFSSSLAITTDIPAAGYDVSTNYTITVENTSTGAAGHGFQLVAERTSDNTRVGTFTAGTGSRINTAGDRITHTDPSNSSWTFTWTSPATAEGNVKFYAASIATNGNGSTSGDQAVTTSTSGDTALGISEAKRLSFDMYPNPATSELKVQLPSGSNDGIVEFYDYMGRLSLSEKISQTSNSINIENLSAGMYILKVLSDDKIGTQKFIKK